MVRSSVLILLLSSSPALAGKKPTATEACTHLVSTQNEAFSVSPDALTVKAFEGACQEIFETADKKQAKNEIACVLQYRTAMTIMDCGKLSKSALEATNPFEPTMREACDNQVVVSEAYAGGGLDDEARKRMHAGCMRDMGMQMILNTPEEMAKKTACMRKAADQAASERCWQ